MAASLAIRPFVASDLPNVLEVLRLSLGEPSGLVRSPELFSWKHFNNPFGRSLMLVAEQDGQVAGFRAFMRWELEAPGDAKLRCVRAVDTATHPDFQRRGIFRMLTLAGIEQATSEGVDLIFNTPNPQSGAGYLTMGWRPVGRVGVMVRPSVRMLRWSPRDSWDVIEESMVDPAGPWINRAPTGWRTPRTAAYLRWRYRGHPTARYRVVGTDGGIAIGRTHIRSGRRELVISELAGTTSRRAVSELRSAVYPDYTVTWFSKGTPERRWAVESGLIPMPGIAALTVMALPLTDRRVDLSWENWDLSMGDLELL